MKQVLFFLMTTSLMITVGCGSQDQTAVGVNDKAKNHSDVLADTANYAALQWVDSTNLELGKVKEGQIVDVNWKFKNVGNKPLIITSVQPGCGCTASEPPKEPIAPGKNGVINAKFDSKGQHEGRHTKNVTVIANTNPTTHYLNFGVEVTKQ
jgi:hypothetical protein